MSQVSSRTLTIYTDYPDTIAKALSDNGLIAIGDIANQSDRFIQIKHPDDGIDPYLKLWLDIAQGLGLIEMYSFNQQSGGRA